ncbi:ATP-grasp domain-containing protein [Rhodoligotrophos defluvii]|uniref:ATP-grasp domain-containing protein n=1 Tax=Rhodoligotrophos defluvii TaxID=2561934 RepID=UPI0010C9582C|nr:RimK family alpha-L-glutamate ligase [Rhodoligotrophos defluvii]
MPHNSRSRSPLVALFADGKDGHATALEKRLEATGALVRRASLADCAFDSTYPGGIAIPGFDGLPDAALVRTIPAGSFEAVTRRLGILHGLREAGTVVWNDARAIERCVDKSTTTFLLGLAGLAVPPTWTVEDREAATAIVRRQARSVPLVLKPLFGAQGRGLRLIRDPDELPAPEEIAGVYYLQRFMGVDRGGYRDYRVFVVAGRAVAAMSRRSDNWITNVKQGGQPEPTLLDEELSRVAVRAAAAVGADFAGVDILRHAPGDALVLEVNSMPAWNGLRQVCDIDIPGAIVAALLQTLAARTPWSAVG